MRSGSMVPGVGIEPTWPCGRGILSPLRLPVSPPGRCRNDVLRCLDDRNSQQRGNPPVPAALCATRARAREDYRSWRCGPGWNPHDGWRPGSELNRRTRLCRPLHNHSATRPVTRCPGGRYPDPGRDALLQLASEKTKPRRCRGFAGSGAGNETRTRDPDLGKVVLYQLSYSRGGSGILPSRSELSTGIPSPARKKGQAACK